MSVTIEQITSAVNGAISPVADQVKAMQAELDVMKKKPVTSNAEGITGTAPAINKGSSDYQKKAYIEADVHKGAGLVVGTIIRAMACASLSAKSGEDDSVFSILNKSGEKRLAEEVKAYNDTHRKQLIEGNAALGGFLVPDQYIAELIPLLRNRAVMRSLGCKVLPMPTGSLTIPKQTGASVATYIGESQPVQRTPLAFGSITMAKKKLSAMIVLSNDLLRDNVIAADMIARDDLVAQMALAEDIAFIRGAGSQYSPKGLLNHVLPANKFAATQAGANATFTEVNADLYKMQGVLEDNNVVCSKEECAWVMNPRSRRYLMQLSTGVGLFPFKQEYELSGTILGLPVYVTASIPKNLGGGTNESEVYLVNKTHLMIADNLGLALEAVNGAAYDVSGTVRSGFSNDETAIRALAAHDFAVRQDNAVSVLSTVKWGA